MKIHKITLANFEWNEFNGFVFTLLGIECSNRNGYFERELFGLHFSKNHLIFEIAFIEFNIKSSI